MYGARTLCIIYQVRTEAVFTILLLLLLLLLLLNSDNSVVLTWRCLQVPRVRQDSPE